MSTAGPLGGIKRTGRGDAPSPTRQRAEPRGGVTLVEISQLLNLQTEQLRQQGLQDLKTATFKELGALKKDVRKHGDFIEQLRDQHAMDQRIKALEEKGPAASTTASGPGRPNLLILAGWPHDTAKDTLLAELQQCLQQLGLSHTFDEYFCTGPRRGFAMAFLTMDASESGQQLKRRMIAVAQQMRAFAPPAWSIWSQVRLSGPRLANPPTNA